MVGSQGVEPRCPLGRLIYSQVQSPVLLATHVTKTLAHRTGLEPVAFCVTGRRSLQLIQRCKTWYTVWESNPSYQRERLGS